MEKPTPALFRRVTVTSTTEYLVPFQEGESVCTDVKGKTVQELMKEWFEDHPATLPYPARDQFLAPRSTKILSIKIGEKERPIRKG